MRRDVCGAAIGLLWLTSGGVASGNGTSSDAEPGSSWTIGASYLADGFAVVDGGQARGTRLLDKLDLYVGWESAAPERRTRAYLDIQYVNGQSISSELIGDVQAVDNLEAPEAWRVAEAWVEQEFMSGRAGLRFGLIDLNAQFDVQALGALFLNSSHGIGPEFSQTGLTGPSIFPTTGLGLTGYTTIGDAWTLRAGVFDGVPGDPDDARRTTIRLSSREGALLIAEAEHRWSELVRLQFGLWGYTAGFERLATTTASPRRSYRNRGGYLLLEGRLLPGTTDERGRRHELRGWLRTGRADEDINAIGRYLGGGLVLSSPFAADDELGLAFARAEFGDPLRRLEGLEAAETAIELTYRRPLTASLTLQPDLQYVRNPGGNASLKDALIVGIRLSWSLEKDL